jgi:hypothetical protein
MRSILAAALLFATPANASIYPWSLGGSAEIVGSISDPVPVSVVLLSFTPGIALPSFAYHLEAYYLFSEDIAANKLSSSLYGVTYLGDPNQPLGNGSFSTTVSFQAGPPVEVSDSARFLVSSLLTSQGFGIATGSVTLGLVLPDGLSVAGEEPIASAIPEPSTWAMLLIGFAGIGFAAYRKRRVSAALRAKLHSMSAW